MLKQKTDHFICTSDSNTSRLRVVQRAFMFCHSGYLKRALKNSPLRSKVWKTSIGGNRNSVRGLGMRRRPLALHGEKLLVSFQDNVMVWWTGDKHVVVSCPIRL